MTLSRRADAEDIEQARRAYLLKRFWIAAKGFLGPPRRQARLDFDGEFAVRCWIDAGCSIRRQRLESRDLRRAGEERRRDRLHANGSSFHWRSDGRHRCTDGLSADGDAAALARVAQRRGPDALAEQTAAIINSISSKATTRIPNTASPRICARRRMRRSIFVVGVVSAALSAVTFIAVLWTIGGSLAVSFGGTKFEIPAFW